MASNEPGKTREACVGEVDIKLSYGDRELPTILTKDFLDVSVEMMKSHMLQLSQLAPILEPITELGLFVKLPGKEENSFEELQDGYCMFDYLEQLSRCLELRLMPK